MSDDAPDFAMRRAVEILAEMYERKTRGAAPPPPLDKTVVLFSETLALDVTATTRERVERALGVAFAYPVRGWHTYCFRTASGARAFVSLFYSQSTLVAAECYLPTLERAPSLEPRDLRFRFVPGELELGMHLARLSAHYARIPTPPGFSTYGDIFEARFAGGSAYVMGSRGIIERLALYALRPGDKNATP